MTPELPLGDDPSAQPHSVTPGSLPLTNRRREAYARARVLGLSPLEAAKEAGFAPGQRGTAWKLERNAKVGLRIKYLSGNTDEVIRAKRARIEARMWQIMDASIKDYTRITDFGGLILDASSIAALPDDEQRELLAVVKKVAQTKYGPVIELHDPLNAASQLRAINGLDMPKQVEVGGIKGGEPIRAEQRVEIDVNQLDRDQLTHLREIVAAAATAGAPVADHD